MKLSEVWAEQAASTLQMIYGGKLKPEVLKKYLESKIDAVQPEKIVLKLRNVYKGTIEEVPAEDILDMVERDKLIIGANGSFCLNQNAYMSPVSKDLIRMKIVRKASKDKQKEAKLRGEHQLASFYENQQTHVKQSTNAYYGIQLQPGSFLFNPDTASLITIQAREMISEMMWTLERVLEGNPQYHSIDECMTYLKGTLSKEFTHAYDDLVTYQPSETEFRRQFVNIYSSIPKIRELVKDSKKSMFIFYKSLSQEDRKRLYYSNNLEALLAKNPRVLAIITSILNEQTPFTSATKIPKEFKDRLDLLMGIIMNFVYAPISNYRRIEKYLHRRRKSIVVSDTDSVMINLGNWTERYSQMSGINVNGFDFEEKCFKIVNVFTHICTMVCRAACKNLCIQCRIPPEYHDLIEMKNEWLFKRMIVYAASKKSYAAHQRLQEGDERDEIEWKGLKLVGSGLSPLVMNATRNFIEFSILKTRDIKPIEILKEVKSIEDQIIAGLKRGDLTLGKSTRFSGDDYKDVYTNAGGRSCLAWNVLYPEDPVNDGDYGYMIDCNLTDEKDLEKVRAVDPQMANLISEKIFHNPEHPLLAKYGINYISIPKDGAFKEIPVWIRAIMDIDGMVNKHLQPITSLLPSICLYRSRISSTRYAHSNLIQF